MPELPEVETVRDGIERNIAGSTLTSITPLHPRVARRSIGGPEALGSLIGRRVDAVVRRGKYLWLNMGEDALVIHLGMSGQVLIDTGDPAPHPHLRAEMMFGEVRARFVDQRTFGHIQLAPLVECDGPGGYGSDAHLIPSTAAHIARDLLDPNLDEAALSKRTRAKRSEIKRAMLDQSLVSGLGNIYCDEALFRAGIHPRRLASGLSYAQLENLWSHARDVLNDALVAGGTSFDALYVNVNGASGYFDRSLRAYGRGGKPCLTCGSLMVREHFMNRSSVFCPTCQPLGRRNGKVG